MIGNRLGTVFDAALVQLGWWTCVLGAARGYALLGPAMVAVLLIAQTWRLPAARRHLAWRQIILLGAAGTALDSLQGALGVLTFRGAVAAWLAPPWITALWCHFVTVLPAFAFLRSWPVTAGLLGALGGPLAYAGGVRLGAAGFHPEPWVSLVVIAAVWAVAFPVMLHVFVAAPNTGGPTSNLITTSPGVATSHGVAAGSAMEGPS